MACVDDMMYLAKTKTTRNQTKPKPKKISHDLSSEILLLHNSRPKDPFRSVVYFEEWQIISTKINPEGVACYAGLLQGRFDMKRATSLFDSFCSNVVRHVVWFC